MYLMHPSHWEGGEREREREREREGEERLRERTREYNIIEKREEIQVGNPNTKHQKVQVLGWDYQGSRFT